MPIQTRNQWWTKTNQHRRSKLQNNVCRELHYSVSTLSNGKIPCGEVAKAVNSLRIDDNFWINKNVTNFAFKIYMDQRKKNRVKGCFSKTTACYFKYWGSRYSYRYWFLIHQHIHQPSQRSNQPENATQKKCSDSSINENISNYLEEKRKHKAKGKKILDWWL